MSDRRIQTSVDLDGLDFAKLTGLLPVVVQDAREGEVLMVAYANRQALERSLATGEMHFWSRSRERLWRKGETSGNVLRVASLHADCDGDAVLARVRPAGPACHTGEATCFGWTGAVSDAPDAVLAGLDAVLAERKRERPEGSYTVRLLDDENLRLKKLGEETTELVVALARGDRDQAVQEAADLVYHVMAALRGADVTLAEVMGALETRRR
jgi:phosphoribosyl-ATP pyrophosphohydrolase/phosphoribosyl-AMP cyclohydrolase